MSAIDESMFSVCYRTSKLTIEDYDEAIDELQRAKTDLRWKREGFALPCCFVCEDTGHTAETCHHNPLLLAREWGKATNVWQCWHCGFVATSAEEADDHFGKSEEETAKCLRSQWQPIETFDAKTVKGPWTDHVMLGHSEKKWIRFGRYDLTLKRWYYSGTNERSQWAQVEGDAPTHWMNLPSPPQI